MITRQEYLEALDLVERYFRQSQTERESKFTEIPKWDKFYQCDIRLQHALMQVFRGGQYVPYHQEYIELVDVKGLARVRGVGQKSINQFIELRGY